LQPPTAIVFDLDGTLVDSAPDIHCALNAVLEQNRLARLGLEAVRLMIGGGPEILVRRALNELGVVAAADEINRLTVSFHNTYLQQGNTHTTLFPGAIGCLKQLVVQDIAIGLCSNKPEPICNQLLSDLGIRKYFNVVQGSGSGLPTKPHPAGLVRALRHLDTATKQALYVGDSKTDVETARAAGVRVALVMGGYTATPAEALGADLVVQGLADIPSAWK
jgi:phosphoglycolate phosphatase